MNWLARIEIPADVARAERITDSYAWHKKIWECFPGRGQDKRCFLSRIDTLEGAYRLWLLSALKPVCPDWCPEEDFSLKKISSSFLSHRYYAFDLKANPVKSLTQRDACGQRKRGKRIPLTDPQELKAWLVRKGQARRLDPTSGQEISGGFRIVEENPLEISPMEESHFVRKGDAAYHGGVRYRGVLEVTDREQFVRTYHEGIGSAKGFGFGLLLLSPVNL